MIDIQHKISVFLKHIKKRFKTFLPGIIGSVVLKGIISFLLDYPSHQFHNIRKMIIKSLPVYPAFICNITYCYLVKWLILQQILECISQGYLGSCPAHAIVFLRQQCLYFLPEPQGHGSFLPTFVFFCTVSFGLTPIASNSL